LEVVHQTPLPEAFQLNSCIDNTVLKYAIIVNYEIKNFFLCTATTG